MTKAATVLLGTLLLAAPLAAAAQTGKPPVIRPTPRVGSMVPAFSVTTLDGQRLTRESLKGKVVLLDFWATWCIPCVKAIPELKELVRKTAGEPFMLLSVSVDEDKKVLEGFLAKNAVTWPQLWDGAMDFTGLFRVHSYPTYILVDHEGRIVYRFSGVVAGKTAEELEANVLRSVAAARKSAPPPGS